MFCIFNFPKSNLAPFPFPFTTDDFKKIDFCPLLSQRLVYCRGFHLTGNFPIPALIVGKNQAVLALGLEML